MIRSRMVDLLGPCRRARVGARSANRCSSPQTLLITVSMRSALPSLLSSTASPGLCFTAEVHPHVGTRGEDGRAPKGSLVVSRTRRAETVATLRGGRCPRCRPPGPRGSVVARADRRRPRWRETLGPGASRGPAVVAGGTVLFRAWDRDHRGPATEEPPDVTRSEAIADGLQTSVVVPRREAAWRKRRKRGPPRRPGAWPTRVRSATPWLDRESRCRP